METLEEERYTLSTFLPLNSNFKREILNGHLTSVPKRAENQRIAFNIAVQLHEQLQGKFAKIYFGYFSPLLYDTAQDEEPIGREQRLINALFPDIAVITETREMPGYDYFAPIYIPDIVIDTMLTEKCPIIRKPN